MTAKKRRDFIIEILVIENLCSTERNKRRQVRQVFCLKRIQEGADENKMQNMPVKRNKGKVLHCLIFVSGTFSLLVCKICFKNVIEQLNMLSLEVN